MVALICASFLLLVGCEQSAVPADPTVAAPTAVATAVPPTVTPPPQGPPPVTPAPQAPPQATPTQPATPVPTAPPAPQPTAAPPAQTPTPEPPAAVRGRVGTVAVARSIDSQQRPRERANEFDAGDRVYVSAEFIGIGAGSSIGISWTRGGRPIFTYEQPVSSAFTRGYFAFYLDPGDATPGDYSAAVLIEGQVQRVVDFTIRP